MARSALLWALLAVVPALACAAGNGASNGVLSGGGLGSASDSDSDSDGGGSTAAGSSGGASEGSSGGEGSTGEGSTGDATGSSSSDGSGESSDSEPVMPMCGELTPCGQLCVDTASDPTNCGGCGIGCVVPKASAACEAGACALAACDPGWGDCDGELANGCEEPLEEGQSCGQICKPQNAEACNLFDDNCDGTCDEGVGGCRVGVHRSNSATLGHFYTTDLAEAQSGDLKLESENYFYLYGGPQEGLVPFYRCLKGNGKRFYTKSANCEGGGTSEGILGHIASDGVCGATELYRLYSGGKGEHFYTISASERDNAVAMYGYKYEAVAGWVWK
ncbi:MAG: hypothetical protein H6711_23115 [Myxococcales bacterium]|nr:hypothetical protein [Myxococcales bacterium]